MGKKYKDPPFFQDLPEINFSDDAEFVLLKKKYDFQDNKKVIGFIKMNPDLEDLMLEAAEQIDIYFPDAKPVLKYFIDHETVGVSNVIISIPTIYSPQETSDRLDQLEDTWWLENEYRSEGKLSINVEFK